MNRVPHQGQFSSGIGDGLVLGFDLETPGLGTRRIGALLALAAQQVRRRRLAHPQTDLERPATVAVGILFAFELQGAYQTGARAS